LADSLTHIFGEEHPAIAAMAEEELIEKLADRVVSRLGTVPKSQAKGEQRYIRDVEAAKYLGVSAATLRSWRSKRSPSGATSHQNRQNGDVLHEGVGAIHGTANR
jgi:hypothetical protein